MTTLLHSIDLPTLRRSFFKRNVLVYSAICLYFLLVCIALEFVCVYFNFAYGLGITTIIFLVLPFAIADTQTNLKNLEKNNGGVLSRKRMIEFTEEGILIRYDSGSSSFIVWPDLIYARRLGEVTLIHQSRLSAHFVPDSAWPSVKERDQFLALLREKNLLK